MLSFDEYYDEEEQTSNSDNNISFTPGQRKTTMPVLTPNVVFYPMGSLMGSLPVDQNNCAIRTVFSFVGGGVMGFVFGPFLSGFGSSPLDYDPNVSLKTKIIQGWKGMASAGWRMAKMFASVGVVFAASECAIEKTRGAHDQWNGIASGCLTGALISAPGGVQAMGLGCLGFAAFSAGIDWIMRGDDPRDRMDAGSIEDLPVKSIFKKTNVEDIDRISIDDLTEEEINAILSDPTLDPAIGDSVTVPDFDTNSSSANEKLLFENFKKRENNEDE